MTVNKPFCGQRNSKTKQKNKNQMIILSMLNVESKLFFSSSMIEIVGMFGNEMTTCLAATQRANTSPNHC